MRTKNIVIISADSSKIDFRSLKIARFLKENGADVEMIFWDRDKNTDHHETREFHGIKSTTFYIQSQRGTFLKQLGAMKEYKKRCKAYLQDKKIDYIQAEDLQGMMVAKYVRANAQTKLVFDMKEHYEDMTPSYRKVRRVIRFLVNRMVKKSFAVLCVAEFIKSGVKEKYDSKFYALPNNPPKEIFEGYQKVDSDQLRIGYFGVVRAQTEVFQMIFEACKDLPNVLIRIRSAGMDFDTLKQIAKDYPNVVLGGAYDAEKDSAQLYSNTDVILCLYPPVGQCASKDFRPIKFMEAMTTGTPVLVSRQMGLSELVEKEGIGYIIEDCTVDEIRKTIQAINTDTKRRKEIEGNIEKMKNLYNWEESAKVLLLVYDL